VKGPTFLVDVDGTILFSESRRMREHDRLTNFKEFASVPGALEFHSTLGPLRLVRDQEHYFREGTLALLASMAKLGRIVFATQNTSAVVANLVKGLKRVKKGWDITACIFRHDAKKTISDCVQYSAQTASQLVVFDDNPDVWTRESIDSVAVVYPIRHFSWRNLLPTWFDYNNRLQLVILLRPIRHLIIEYIASELLLNLAAANETELKDETYRVVEDAPLKRIKFCDSCENYTYFKMGEGIGRSACDSCNYQPDPQSSGGNSPVRNS